MIQVNPSPSGLLVDVQDVTYVYQSRGAELVALRDHDLQVATGEKVAIVGPSGSGKTTLLNLLACMETAQKGRVRVAGVDLASLSDQDRLTYRRTMVGYVWQRAGEGLWPGLTAFENVQIPMIAARGSGMERLARARQLMEALRIDDKMRLLPGQLGYEDTQRLALAVALANQPRLLLADELTSDLDLASSDRLLDDMDALIRHFGTTAVLVTHDLELERGVDRVIPMQLARNVPEIEGDLRLLDELDPEASTAALEHMRDILVADSVTLTAQRGDTRVAVIDGASLRVRQSEFVAILGRSGSGKSSLLRLCGGLVSPTSGRVAIAGRDLARLGRNQRELLLQKHIGWVFHGTSAPLLVTPAESVALTAQIGGASSAEARAVSHTALRATGLAERANYPMTRLSGGELQRVALARAMVKGPAIIIADEPTAQLDTITANGILALLREAAYSGVAVLLATHEPLVAEVADRVLIMEDGRLREARNRRW